ncbi:unnamed protein product [Caenorhabditis sp. 36 PRJEB53466]|nr:unnamed protein product [Caenorhabditis sp. 36 PRJEB53466]
MDMQRKQPSHWYPPEIAAALEAQYQKTKFCSTYDMKALERSTGVGRPSLRVWFTRRRERERRESGNPDVVPKCEKFHFSDRVISMLLEHFTNVNAHPQKQEAKELAEKVGLTEHQVMNWFQNRRRGESSRATKNEENTAKVLARELLETYFQAQKDGEKDVRSDCNAPTRNANRANGVFGQKLDVETKDAAGHYSEKAKKVLVEFYVQKRKCPDWEEVVELGKKSGLTWKQIQHWFEIRLVRGGNAKIDNVDDEEAAGKKLRKSDEDEKSVTPIVPEAHNILGMPIDPFIQYLSAFY